MRENVAFSLAKKNILKIIRAECEGRRRVKGNMNILAMFTNKLHVLVQWINERKMSTTSMTRFKDLRLILSAKKQYKRLGEIKPAAMAFEERRNKVYV